MSYLYEKKFAARDGSQTNPALAVQGLALLGADGNVGRPRGFNSVSPRYELRWVAGAQGLPQLNAVTDPSAGDTYSTAGFLALLNADRHFEILGANATSDDVTISAEGGVVLATDGGGTDSVILLPHLNTGQSPWTSVTWGSDKETEWEADVTLGASAAGVVWWAGLKLTNTATVATDADQAFFRYGGSGNWIAVYSIGGTDVEADTGVAVTAGDRVHLAIKIDSARVARFYINGVHQITTTALTTAKDFIPYIGVLESAAASKTITVHGQAISRVIG